MYNFRLADDEDIEAVLMLGRKFYDTTESAKMIPFDEDSGVAQIIQMLDHGFIVLADTADKELVGMIGMTMHDFPFNRSYQVCVETMFWIEEAHRGGTLASRLLKEAELLAIAEGACIVTMAALETSPDMIESFYKRLGYSRSERTFIKGI